MTASSPPISSRRRWLTLSVATVLLQFAYWPIVASLVLGDAEQAGLLWLGLAVVPFVFLVLAFGSGHLRAPGATGRAMGLFLLVSLPVGLGNAVMGLVLGFGVAAAVALRRDDDVHSFRARLWAVGGAGVYLLLLLVGSAVWSVLGPFAIISGAILPLAVVGIADEVLEAPDDQEREHHT